MALAGSDAQEPAGNIALSPVPSPDLIQLFEAAKAARLDFEVLRRRRRTKAMTWGALALLSALPAVWVLTFPEQVVSAVPASIDIYKALERDVNIYGVEIRQVDLEHLHVDGKEIIAVKGELVNVSSSTRKIPWLRFGLKSRDNAEVYHWTLDTEARPLKPGETTSFVTRLAAPPENARDVEIRFARADEIGSNDQP